MSTYPEEFKALEEENKRLEAENKKLKRRLKKCICPHCGFGFEQALLCKEIKKG